MKSGVHPFVMCNFAPPDMVGHTGVYEAAIKVCEGRKRPRCGGLERGHTGVYEAAITVCGGSECASRAGLKGLQVGDYGTVAFHYIRAELLRGHTGVYKAAIKECEGKMLDAPG